MVGGGGGLKLGRGENLTLSNIVVLGSWHTEMDGLAGILLGYGIPRGVLDRWPGSGRCVGC